MDDIINVDDKSTPPATDTPKNDEFLSALVGEGKKYASIEELAKAYVNIDEFAETLKAENRELKEKVTKVATVEELMQKLSTKSDNGLQDDPPAKTHSIEGVKPEDIEKLIKDTVTGLETSKLRTANLAKANAMLNETFGDKAKEVFKEVANTPELQRVYKELAEIDPDKFIRQFVEVPKNTSAPASQGGSAPMTNGQGNRSAQEGTKEFYDNVRRTNKALYYSQEFQIKMDKAVRSNPDLYYGR